MKDSDALEVIKELKEMNQKGLLKTPEGIQNDPLYDCAFYHAIRALEERIKSK